MCKRNNSDLFFVCSLIEQSGRDLYLRHSESLTLLGEKNIRTLLSHADVHHSEPMQRVADEVMTEFSLPEGAFDKVCMVTGHRDLPVEEIGRIKEELRCEILQAIESGYTHFISGFAQGVDLYFADIVAELKESYPITLEAAIPYLNRTKTKDEDFHRLLAECDVIGIHSEEYSRECFLKRNRIMVQLSSRVIAVYDGRGKGGTFATMRYARIMEREIHIIKV